MRKKRLRHIEQKKISKECWNLDYHFRCWLEPRLKTYLKEADKVVDLEYHKFNYKEESLTQKQIIIRMIDLLQELSDEDTKTSLYWTNIEEWCKKQTELTELWSLVMPAMWW